MLTWRDILKMALLVLALWVVMFLGVALGWVMLWEYLYQ